MTTTIHPYFVAKAAQWMRRAGGRAEDAEDLARWAQIAWHADRLGMAGARLRGVVIAEDGTLLAETRRSREPGRGVSAVCVVPEDLKRLTGAAVPNVVDMAMSAIGRAVGRPVRHVRFSEVCQGREPRH